MSADGAAEPGLDPIAAVEACRAQGAAQVDPVGFGVIEALARRAAVQQGEARRLMMRRVEALLAERAAAKRADSATDEFSVRRAALAGLSDLVERLGRTQASPEPVSSPRPRGAPAVRADAPMTTTLSRTVPLQPLKAATVFKGTWSRLRAEQRLRQALAQVPAGAGPLNSSHLVNRTLQAMRDLSPEYLDAFMSHVDTLQWLDQASGAGLPVPAPVAPAEGKRRPAARAGRKG